MYDAQFNNYADNVVEQASPSVHREASVAPASHATNRALHAELLVSMLDEIDYGLVVLDADGQILLANHPARLELGAERHVRQRGDRLAASAARYNAKIELALDEVGQGRRSLVTLSDREGELALSFVPLNASAYPVMRKSEALALVVFGKRTGCEALTLQQYGRLHGLTGAEQALLPAIIRGLSVDAIAREQCVAVSTVRTQLGSIRGKTGVDSLRTLMARLNNLPPIRPAFKQTRAH